MCFCGVEGLWGGTVSFSGNFTFDDDIAIFYYNVANTGSVTIETTSYTGGGFVPVLSVFTADGTLWLYDEGYSGNREASIIYPSLGGVNYIVTLTEWDNLPQSKLAAGFTQQGAGNFTGVANDPLGTGAFVMPGPDYRSSFWSVDFMSADPTFSVTQAVPGPSTAILGLAGGLWIAARVRARRQKLHLD